MSIALMQKYLVGGALCKFVTAIVGLQKSKCKIKRMKGLPEAPGEEIHLSALHDFFLG